MVQGLLFFIVGIVLLISRAVAPSIVFFLLGIANIWMGRKGGSNPPSGG